MISARTRLCAVIGHPVGHSLSPEIHNAAFAAADVDYAYVAFDVEDAARALEGAIALGIRGLSVTIPHKVAALRALEELDGTIHPSAEDAGAINTVVNEGGRLVGYNTDGAGALDALLAADVHPSRKPCVLLGAGGAARGIAFELLRHGGLKELWIVDVVPEKTAALVRDLGKVSSARITASRPEDLEELLEGRVLLIHATPVGMHPDDESSPLPARFLRREHVVLDIVYTPLRTRLLRDAEAAGARAIPGVEMFVGQAARQFTLWTGKAAPVDVMRRVVMEKLGAKG